MLNFEALLKTLPFMGMGMAGIFIVVFVIYISVFTMNKIFKKKEENE